jgi:hypothetical protein
MSVRIVLRSGKVLVYNDGRGIRILNGCVEVSPRDTACLVAQIPLDIVERAEFAPPCQIYKERPLRRLRERKS